MIEIRSKQILIDGKPRIIIGGEIHYFRLKREEWQDRIDKLKAAGCNMVASYVPWLCHEFVEGKVDLEGTTRPELDLGGFIDLCKENGLYFFVRPGPFIMAEMKNEGLPYWVYEKHPEAIPVTWDGKLVTSKTLDYLAPGFLEEARHWYSAVMPVIAPRLITNGGNIIAVQLDNEIGMLSWVTNSPDLTDHLLADFVVWLEEKYDAETLKARYPFPISMDDGRQTTDDGGELTSSVVRRPSSVLSEAIRFPREEYAAALMRDLGHYMRYRFARYVAILRQNAEEFGVAGVPFLVNIHGTDRGRAFSYPIGISQLYESYTQDEGYLAGSDHYLGELGVGKFQDIYLINALMEAVNTPDQPLASVEFEAGSGDYGDRWGARNDPSTADHKTRMCVAQGNRLISYYLFTGGINYHLDAPVGDGNDRIAFTGERHGFAAPVNPEGELSYTYPALRRGVTAVMAVEDKLAGMSEERDGVAFAFVPDYYMTESKYPESVVMNEIAANLEANRGPGAWENVARAMLLAGYRFTAVDVQNREIDPGATPVLVLPSARYMDGALQRKLVDYLHAGGRMLLYGEMPLFDMEAHDCTAFAEALGLTPAGSREAIAHYYLSLDSKGWAAPHAEVRSGYAQAFEPSRGEVILRVTGTGEACGFDIDVGEGRAIAITADYPCHVGFVKKALEELGAKSSLGHDCPDYGIFLTSTASADGERFLHVINLDGFEKSFHIIERREQLLGGREIRLRSREAVMLPLNVSFEDARILYSTAEIVRVGDDSIEFRLTQPQDVIAFEGNRAIAPGDDYRIEKQGETTLVISNKHAAVDDHLTVNFEL
jgi:beta-galactosidase